MKKNIVILSVVILLIIIATIGGYFVLKNKGKNIIIRGRNRKSLMIYLNTYNEYQSLNEGVVSDFFVKYKDRIKLNEIVRNPMFYKKYQSEDLFISYFARKCGMKIISILPKCKIIKDGLDSCHTTKPLKKEAYKILINSGWKFYG